MSYVCSTALTAVVLIFEILSQPQSHIFIRSDGLFIHSFILPFKARILPIAQ